MGTIGANLGGNLNIFLFEVGMIIRDDDGEETVKTVGIHPLLVAPTSVSYTDQSRSPVTQTTGGGLKTISGRGFRQVQMRGTFGVDERGLLLYLGTGQVRFQRFYKEVVRMADAVNKDDVKAATDLLRGTPFLPLLTAPYVDDSTVFFINFYDFWNERQFACTIRNWNDNRAFNQGGASGLVQYTMLLEEEGPIVTGSLATTIINALFNALATWTAINDVIKSYTLGNLLGAQAAFGAILLSQFNQTLAAVQAQLDSATGVMGGFSGASDPGLTTFLTQAQALKDAVDGIVETFQGGGSTASSDGFDADEALVDWSATPGEGQNDGLELSEQLDELEDLGDAAAFQTAAGAFYGMSQEDYQAYITGAGGSSVSPSIQGTVEYTVGPTDTEATIEAVFNVPFDLVLDLNGLTPDQALFNGRKLLIPVRRGQGPQSIDGLPTFGSHLGRAAWGADLTTSLDTAAGDFVVLRDTPVLEQGVDWIVDEFGAELVATLNQTPAPVRDQMLSLRLTNMLLSDKRISSVDEVVAEDLAASATLAIEVTMTAINGTTITTGRPRV